MYNKLMRAFYTHKLNKFSNEYDFYKSIVSKCDTVLCKKDIYSPEFRNIFILYTIHILTDYDSLKNHKIGLFLLIDISDLFLDNFELFKEDIEKLRYLNTLKLSLKKY